MAMDLPAISEFIWKTRYRSEGAAAGDESNITATWRRVARAVANIESHPQQWEEAFYAALCDFSFLPGGRILAGAGTDRRVTLMNCFVAGPIDDSVQGIIESLGEAAVTMQFGGGIGCDFSTLRPSGMPAVKSGRIASGPVSFMHVWNELCATLLSTSARRGAMMGTLRCDHPDIEAFVGAKRTPGSLENFNLSVLISDKFMQAVRDDADWSLVDAAGAEHRRLPANSLWRQIVETAYESDEPGLLFIDRINRDNNLYYCEAISAANPCGEIPMPPYGACDLGSINLASLVLEPFSTRARLDLDSLRRISKVAVRFLDNVIDLSRFPLQRQAEHARATRRIGLGITGLADMLVMLGLHYDSDAARRAAGETMKIIRDAAYECSVELAREKGAFPMLNKDNYLEAPFIRELPEHLVSAIGQTGIRNSHLLAIAPAGSISLLAGNVSSGIEPVFAVESERSIRNADGESEEVRVCDYAYRLWSDRASEGETRPECFVTTMELPAAAHLAMQSCLQQYVDQGISKTVNLAAATTIEDVANLYFEAWEQGVKGCTVFRPAAHKAQIVRRCVAPASMREEEADDA